MSLTVHGHSVDGVFRLLGADENSATRAVGWALDRCSVFRDGFFRRIVGRRVRVTEEPHIALQKSGKDGGFTDIEVHVGRDLHIIVEAKAGWELPSLRQLQRYARRFSEDKVAAPFLVTVSATPAFIAARQGIAHVGRIPVLHLSWSDVRNLARVAYKGTMDLGEKRWLREVDQHLEEFVAMDRRSSNDVYVVALRTEPIRRGSTYSWVDVVEREGRYFHPVGRGWPTEPPNYIGFRYRGRLQSVHHVEAVEIVVNLRSMHDDWPKTTRDHFVYRLGPAMKPAQEIRTGNLFRAGRVRCAIDTLLSGKYKTIAKARDASTRRMKGGAGQKN